LCRHFHDLTYESRNESVHLLCTAKRKTRRLAGKLGLSEPEDVYIMDRPKGMQRRHSNGSNATL
jgi:hypothetical protein